MNIPLKYRPRTLANLVGQPYIQTTLVNTLRTQLIAPAYLFTGSRGTGKTSTARIFAKSLNCLNSDVPTAQPCGECQSCRSIEQSSSLDVSEIDAASNNGVDDARNLIERSHFAPASGRYRVFILDEVHQLSTAAFNTLLKTLEEPPPHVVFILCTTEAHKVPATITSRCQVFNFRTIKSKTIAAHLRTIADAEAILISDEALQAISRICDGGMRDALQLLGQLSLLGKDEISAEDVVEITGAVTEAELLSILNSAVAGDVFRLLQASRSILDEGKPVKLILSSLLQTLRDILLIKSAPDATNLLSCPVSQRQLLKQAQKWDFEAIDTALSHLQACEVSLRNSTNTHVWLEICLIGLIPTLAVQSTTNGKKGNHPSAELDQVWQQVIQHAKPKAQALLRRARLIKLHGSTAVLTVEPQYIERFKANSYQLGKMLQKATGSHTPIDVSV